MHYKIYIVTSDVRSEMETLLPRSYKNHTKIEFDSESWVLLGKIERTSSR